MAQSGENLSEYTLKYPKPWLKKYNPTFEVKTTSTPSEVKRKFNLNVHDPSPGILNDHSLT